MALIKSINECIRTTLFSNIIYKNNGEERYPEFKLYKMIARNVHNNVPKDQLNNTIFKKFILSKKKIKKQFVFNIDKL